jgi:hypothetical protein
VNWFTFAENKYIWEMCPVLPLPGQGIAIGRDEKREFSAFLLLR